MNPLQFEFDWLLAHTRPLLRVAETATLLGDCSEQHVHNLLDAGKLRGIDVSGQAEERRAVRIWRHTILHLLLKPGVDCAPVHLEDLLPHARPTIWRRELAAWCACAENTVAEWGLRGPRTDTRSLYDRAEVLRFLREREIKP